MAIEYYCLRCKRHISESEVRTVIRVGRGGAFGVVIHREPCGGDALYREEGEDSYYLPVPSAVVLPSDEARADAPDTQGDGDEH